ncbi:unnamed protein product [Closterium sp. NIES-65]|nr:unnamed protein product [Closterium sp. NIES-65]
MASAVLSENTPSSRESTRPTADSLSRRQQLDVAVIGAGAAGLAAARELMREGHAVTVIEAGGAAGGIGNGERVEGREEGRKEEREVRAEEGEEEREFDVLVVCNGHYSQPKIASIAGVDTWPGIQMHSHNYRHPEGFAGKVRRHPEGFAGKVRRHPEGFAGKVRRHPEGFAGKVRRQPEGFARKVRRHPEGFAGKVRRHPEGFAGKVRRHPEGFAGKVRRHPEGFAGKVRRQPEGFARKVRRHPEGFAGKVRRHPEGFAGKVRRHPEGFAGKVRRHPEGFAGKVRRQPEGFARKVRRHPEGFARKVVVMVGAEVSGLDIARELAAVAREVHICAREGGGRKMLVEHWRLHISNFSSPHPTPWQVVVVVGAEASGQDIAREVAAVAREVHICAREGGGRKMLVEHWRLHISNFSSPHPTPWQVVVVVGAEASGQDIAREVAAVAREVHICARGWRSSPAAAAAVAGAGAGAATGAIETGYFEDLKGRVQQHPMIKQANADGTVEFEDGFTCHADVIMHCTGYSFSFPFLALPPSLLSVDTGRVTPLFRHVLPPALAPSLSFIGLPWKVVPFPLCQLQARWVAQLLSGQLPVPPRSDMEDGVRRLYARMEEQGVPERYAHRLDMEQVQPGGGRLGCCATWGGKDEWRYRVREDCV